MSDAGFGLYVHWPFCLSKCPYCDFNSHAMGNVDQGQWADGLEAELDHYHRSFAGRPLTSIFFGGGTPSLMAPATIDRLINRAAALWGLEANVEITLEANPSTAEIGRFRDFRAAGINRLSIGIQALNDADLTFLGRRHDLAEGLTALKMADQVFDRFSFDLIYARPGQTLAAWRDELAQALDLAGSHLSLYQLTIEDGTAFAPRHGRGEFSLPDDDLAADLFQMTQDLTAQAGLPAYEVSNHARPGQESRHNLIYWQGGDYVGIGPGAHGRLGRRATRQHRAPEIWLERAKAQGHATQQDLDLAETDRAVEMVMMGLRLWAGFRPSLVLSTTGVTVDEVVNAKEFSALQSAGLIVRDADLIRVTPLGRALTGAITARLLGG